MTMIRTPDQRLRVFISSTMHELAPERIAARKAVEELRLSPILFELGARPHPPRELYRAYLDQSHIFIGIYWQSYGWVGPGMEISGLEDEFEIAADKPKLIYVKSPASDRDSQLGQLLERIKTEAGVSYKQFSDTAELQRLVADDLAVLLTESFELGADPKSGAESTSSNLPAFVDRFIGREAELEELTRILRSNDTRLVTLVGPGGIGKTRLALEAAVRCEGEFDDGVLHVPLGPITRAELVIPTIAQSLDTKGTTSDPLVAVIEYLRNRHFLLVLDNFEQVIFAAPDVARIAEACERLTILVTSRATLNVRAEHEFHVEPLALPPEEFDGRNVEDYEAVRLFMDRARAINPGFDLARENAQAIAMICRRLDGLPLALELAAARTRLLSPEAMLARLDSSLQLLTTSSRDVPERHQTLRAAIDWSFGLLDKDEKRLFVRMGIFHGGCTLDAAEQVCNSNDDLDLLDLMSSLLEKSLIKHQADTGEPRFTMLRTVWEYASELLHANPDVEDVRAAHARYFLELIAASYDGLRSSGQLAWLERLNKDHDNMRSALHWCLDQGDAESVAEAGWTLWLFWWLDFHLSEGRKLMADALAVDGMSDAARAKASAVEGIMAFWQSDYEHAIPLISSALELFKKTGPPVGVAYCQIPIAFAEAAMGSLESAQQRFEKSINTFKQANDEWGTVISMNALCWAANAVRLPTPDDVYEEALERAEKLGTRMDVGMALRNLGGRRSDQERNTEAKELYARALETLWRGNVRGGTTYTIDGIADVALKEGDHPVATWLSAAMDAAREATLAPMIPMQAPRFERFIKELRRVMGDEAFEKEWGRGRRLSLDQAVKLALSWARGEGAHLQSDDALIVR